MKENIPRIIHYCWFGGKPLPELAIKCINSWKVHCPDYKIIKWDEHNFNLNENTYIYEAYQMGRWAFITDYVRLKVLYEYGGIYMDTDVEVLKNLNEFLTEYSFSGFERQKAIPTGIMASAKNMQLFSDLLDYYKDRHFILTDGSVDTTTNVTIITKMLLEKGLKLNNKKQTIAQFTLYPNDYFCPKNYFTGEINLTPNSYTIHHFNGSWKTEEAKLEEKLRIKLNNKYGNIIGSICFYIKILKNNIKQHGIKDSVTIIKQRIRTKFGWNKGV